MTRTLADIIAHIRMVIADPTVNTTLIQTEDLAVLCDAAEVLAPQAPAGEVVGVLTEIYNAGGPRNRLGVVPPADYAKMTTVFIDEQWDFEMRHLMHRIAKLLAHQHHFHWTDDPNAALRFMTQEQADATMMGIRELAPDLFGFAVTLGEARPVEHGWLGHPPAPDAEALVRAEPKNPITYYSRLYGKITRRARKGEVK